MHGSGPDRVAGLLAVGADLRSDARAARAARISTVRSSLCDDRQGQDGERAAQGKGSVYVTAVASRTSRSGHTGPGLRVYYGRRGEELVILLGDDTKRRQQADIDRAKADWLEYLGRAETWH